MDKIAKIGLLIDFYGNLLTEKQLNIIDMHYNNDYSLGEISENIGISRQGVFDSLKRSENILVSYEEKLKLVDKFVHQKDSINNALIKLSQIKNKEIKKDIEVKLDEVISILKPLSETE